MRRAVTVTELIEVPCSQEDALAAIWAIQDIYKTEVKVDTVQMIPQTDRTGTYKARGRAAFIPWHNEFFYTLHDHGFHSVEAYPPPSGPRIHGGFSVVSTGAQDCLILHYEQYSVPHWAVPLTPLIAWYLRWSMKKELRDLRALILHRSSTAELS
jgi:hypothetical protein